MKIPENTLSLSWNHKDFAYSLTVCRHKSTKTCPDPTFNARQQRMELPDRYSPPSLANAMETTSCSPINSQRMPPKRDDHC